MCDIFQDLSDLSNRVLGEWNTREGFCIPVTKAINRRSWNRQRTWTSEAPLLQSWMLFTVNVIHEKSCWAKSPAPSYSYWKCAASDESIRSSKKSLRLQLKQNLRSKIHKLLVTLIIIFRTPYNMSYLQKVNGQLMVKTYPSMFRIHNISAVRCLMSNKRVHSKWKIKLFVASEFHSELLEVELYCG